MIPFACGCCGGGGLGRGDGGGAGGEVLMLLPLWCPSYVGCRAIISQAHANRHNAIALLAGTLVWESGFHASCQSFNPLRNLLREQFELLEGG